MAYQEITVPNMPIDINNPELNTQDIIKAWKDLRDYRLHLERVAKTIKSELEDELEQVIIERMHKDGVEGFRVPDGNCYMTKTAHLEVTNPEQFITQMYNCMNKTVEHGGSLTDVLWLQMRPAKQRLEEFVSELQVHRTGTAHTITDESFNTTLGDAIGVKRITKESLGFRNK